MFPDAPDLTLLELKSATVHAALIVSPDTPVLSAIDHMNRMQLRHRPTEALVQKSCCHTATTNLPIDSQLNNLRDSALSRCILVVENQQLVGILTEGDVVRLSLQQQPLDRLVMQQVMTSPVITLHTSAFTDLGSAMHLLQQHTIRYLPILDEQDRPVGVVNRESLHVAIGIYQFHASQQLQSELAERQRTEALLQAQLAELIAWRDRYELAAQASGYLFYDYDLRQDRIAWGVRTECILGYSASALPTHLSGWIALIHPDDQAKFRLATERAIADRTPLFTQYRVQHHAGHFLWIEDRSQWLVNDQGEATGVVGILTDISDRKQAEEALQHSEAHQRALMRAIPDLIMRINRAGIYLEFVATPNFHVVGNIPEMVGTHVSETLPPEVAQKRMEFMQLALQTQAIQMYEQDLSIDGRTQIEEVRIVPYGKDEVLTLVRDISERKRVEAERKQAELALQQSEAKHRAVLEAIPDLMFRVGADGVYREFITLHREFDVLSQEIDPTGRAMVDLLPAALAERQLYYLQQALQTGELQVYEQTVQIGDRWQDEEVRVVKSGEDEVLFMTRNITDRKRAEAALQTLVESTAAVTGKDFFAALAQQLMLALKVQHVLVTRLVGDHLQTLAYWKDGMSQPEITFALADAPCCAAAIEQGQFYCPTGLQQRFAGYPLIQSLQADSYLGIPLTSIEGQRLGNLCILDCNPLHDIQWAEAFLRIFAMRAAAELERQQATEALEHLNQALEVRVEQRTDALCKSEANLSAIFNQAAVGINQATLDGQYLKVNQKLCDILGYTPAELLSKNFKEVSHPEDVIKGEEERRQLYAGVIDSFAIEKRCLHKDGSIVWINLTVSLVRKPSGEPDYSIGVVEDITDRKRTEEALRHSEEQFRTVFDHAPIAISLARVEDYKIFRVNAAHYQLFGYSDAELATITFADFTYPNDIEQSIEQVQQVVRGEIPGFQMEKRFVKKNGDVIVTNMVVALIRDQAGHPLYIMAMNQDISQRKQAEMLLKAQQEFLRRLIDTVPNLIFVKDCVGRFTLVNQATAAVYQSTIEDLVGQTDAHFNPNQAEVEYFMAIDREVMTTLTTKVVEETITSPNGKQRYFQTIKIPIISMDGYSREILGVATDITDRKQIEEQLRCSETHLLEAQRIAHVGSWQFDIATSKITWSAETFRIFGRNPIQQEPTYKELLQSLHPNDREHHQTVFQGAIEQVNPFELEYRVIQADGSVTYVLAKGQPILDATGKFLSFLGAILDITDRKQFEAQLRQTNEQLAHTNMQLARATQLKDEFLANMSHELRTPLNAILGMAEGLQDQVFGVMNERQLKALGTIEQSGSHLLELIDDILDVAKIEAGQMELHCTPTTVALLCQSSLAFVKQQALKKHIWINTKLPRHLPDFYLDERRIRQVLINLLNNAVKFTPDGGQITLEVSRYQSPADPSTNDLPSQHFLRIAVTDTGIGIAPEHLSQLFQPFIQIDSALNRKYQGTGLGLALVKRIVELHGGQVGVTSEVGLGSCFTIDLPCTNDVFDFAGPDPSDANVSSQPSDASPLILLVEDNEENSNTVSCYLEAKGCRLLLAKNGQDAIALAQSKNPDLILLDIQMPGVDGLEALQQIRRDPDLVDVPVIALTALAMPGDCDRCLLAGANDYLTKPFKLKQLATTIQRLLRVQ